MVQGGGFQGGGLNGIKPSMIEKIIWFRLRGVGLSELLLTFPRGFLVGPLR